MKHEILIHDTTGLDRAAGEFLKETVGHNLIAFFAPMGAGKTTFTTAICRRLGVSDAVCSPTFTIVNEYLGERELIHFDMYRLSSADELFDIGWEDYLSRGAVCAVEWSENVQDAFFGDEVVVRIEKLNDTDRKITIEGAELC